MDKMKLHINGEERKFLTVSNVRELLQSLGILEGMRVKQRINIPSANGAALYQPNAKR
jgi:hypothetical protein